MTRSQEFRTRLNTPLLSYKDRDILADWSDRFTRYQSDNKDGTMPLDPRDEEVLMALSQLPKFIRAQLFLVKGLDLNTDDQATRLRANGINGFFHPILQRVLTGFLGAGKVNYERLEEMIARVERYPKQDQIRILRSLRIRMEAAEIFHRFTNNLSAKFQILVQDRWVTFPSGVTYPVLKHAQAGQVQILVPIGNMLVKRRPTYDSLTVARVLPQASLDQMPTAFGPDGRFMVPHIEYKAIILAERNQGYVPIWLFPKPNGKVYSETYLSMLRYMNRDWEYVHWRDMSDAYRLYYLELARDHDHSEMQAAYEANLHRFSWEDYLE